MRKQYDLLYPITTAYRNNTTFCIGTGRIGLGLHKEYLDQLELVQKEICFKHIRGHGLFNEDLGIFQQYTGPDGTVKSEYNFTYLDFVFDNYIKLGIHPFIELGFMPAGLASGTQEVFFWKGNVTPPKDYNEWAKLVTATLRHLLTRYGETALTFPIEVWNEPNLGGFWQNADKKEYFKLYKCSAEAVKSVNAQFRVGGPAICGVDDESWLRDFLEFIRDEHVPIDFVTRHLYDITNPETEGRYGYPKLNPLNKALNETERSRKIIDSFREFIGMEMHVTEFNTSYSPRTPIHDTNINAAYVAFLLSRLGDDCASYSYWTFGDLFEEQGIPYTPFHGGFGLVANGGIKKPTFYALKFFRDMGDGEIIHRSDEAIVTRDKEGGVRGIAWNICPQAKREVLELNFTLPASDKTRCVIIKTVDENTCNPLKVWHDLGQPRNPSEHQLELLKSVSEPLVRTRQLSDNTLDLRLAPNALVYFEVMDIFERRDRGFDYNKAIEVEFA